MFVTGEMPDAIVEKKGLKQSDDTDEIEAYCLQAIAGNAKAVGQYKEGNTKALNALKGPVMKATKGKANPAMLDDLLKKPTIMAGGTPLNQTGASIIISILYQSAGCNELAEILTQSLYLQLIMRMFKSVLFFGAAKLDYCMFKALLPGWRKKFSSSSLLPGLAVRPSVRSYRL